MPLSALAQPGTVFLMYHELEVPGRPLCQSGSGYVRYVLSATDFEAQMRWLKAAGWRGLSVSSALNFAGTQEVGITFDDGCETDLLIAAPILRELDFGATFYVTAGFLGRHGFLSPAQLRYLSEDGFEIGCHSLTHSYLPDLDDDGLHRETAGAKQELEQIIGREVEHFSCPGGRYDRRVADMVRRAGFRSMATSRARSNSPSTDCLELGRVAVMRQTELQSFQKICSGEALWKLHAYEAVKNSTKRLLGNRFYDRLRAAMLRGN